MISPCAAARAALRPAGVFPFGFSTTAAPAERASPAVSSEEPPSATITSIPPATRCSRMERTQSSMVAASLRAGTMTETRGRPSRMYCPRARDAGPGAEQLCHRCPREVRQKRSEASFATAKANVLAGVLRASQTLRERLMGVDRPGVDVEDGRPSRVEAPLCSGSADRVREHPKLDC